jgi:hypothetical protein
MGLSIDSQSCPCVTHLMSVHCTQALTVSCCVVPQTRRGFAAQSCRPRRIWQPDTGRAARMGSLVFVSQHASKPMPSCLLTDTSLDGGCAAQTQPCRLHTCPVPLAGCCGRKGAWCCTAKNACCDLPGLVPVRRARKHDTAPSKSKGTGKALSMAECMRWPGASSSTSVSSLGCLMP